MTFAGKGIEPISKCRKKLNVVIQKQKLWKDFFSRGVYV